MVQPHKYRTYFDESYNEDVKNTFRDQNKSWKIGVIHFGDKTMEFEFHFPDSLDPQIEVNQDYIGYDLVWPGK